MPDTLEMLEIVRMRMRECLGEQCPFFSSGARWGAVPPLRNSPLEL